MSAKQGYLPTLDGWRAVAIMAVILDHVDTWRLRPTHPTLFKFTRAGPNGVSLFFAISGFLICSRLLEEQNAIGKISLRGFYIRRGLRILPAALTYLAVVGLLSLAGYILVSPWEWWSSILFFRNYLPPEMISRGWGGYTVHYWSLAVEEHFYLLWPGLLVLVGAKYSRYVASALALAVSIWRWWDFHHHWMDKHIPGLLFGSRTDVRLDGLLMGCLAALLLAGSGFRSWTVRNLGWPIWCLCIVLYLGIQVLSRHHYYSIWESTLLTVIVVWTVLNPSTWIGYILEYPTVRLVGRLSYSLYLWQELFAVPQAKYPVSLLQRFPLDLILLFFVATLSYQFIERPLIRLGHRLAPPPTPGRQDLSQRVPSPAL
jgi:peptidoglycan/LPS O-acetylase OafA/YrhL